MESGSTANALHGGGELAAHFVSGRPLNLRVGLIEPAEGIQRLAAIALKTIRFGVLRLAGMSRPALVAVGISPPTVFFTLAAGVSPPTMCGGWRAPANKVCARGDPSGCSRSVVEAWPALPGLLHEIRLCQ